MKIENPVPKYPCLVHAHQSTSTFPFIKIENPKSSSMPSPQSITGPARVLFLAGPAGRDEFINLRMDGEIVRTSSRTPIIGLHTDLRRRLARVDAGRFVLVLAGSAALPASTFLWILAAELDMHFANTVSGISIQLDGEAPDCCRRSNRNAADIDGLICVEVCRETSEAGDWVLLVVTPRAAGAIEIVKVESVAGVVGICSGFIALLGGSWWFFWLWRTTTAGTRNRRTLKLDRELHCPVLVATWN